MSGGNGVARPEADEPPPPQGVLGMAVVSGLMLAVSCMCAVGSGLALYFGESSQDVDPISAIAIMQSGSQVARIDTGGMIVVGDESAGMVVGEAIYDREGEIAVIDSAGVVSIGRQREGAVDDQGVISWTGAPHWRIAQDGTITREGDTTAWGRARGYSGTRGDRRALAAYLLFFED